MLQFKHVVVRSSNIDQIAEYLSELEKKPVLAVSSHNGARMQAYFVYVQQHGLVGDTYRFQLLSPQRDSLLIQYLIPINGLAVVSMDYGIFMGSWEEVVNDARMSVTLILCPTLMSGV